VFFFFFLRNFIENQTLVVKKLKVGKKSEVVVV